MARPLKEGVDYYPTDVNLFNDPKIEELLDRHGPMGYTIYICILNKVYANGYYLEYDPKSFPFSIRKCIGNKWIKNNEVVLQVMHSCADIGLFDNDLMHRNIITSVGIQRRFKEITVRRRQKVMLKYCILKDAVLNEQNILDIDNNNSINANNNTVNEVDNSIKVKESNNTCSEQTPNKQDQYSFLLKDGTLYILDVQSIQELSNVFKLVNVIEEIKKMELWCKVNPKKRKTREGAMKFITNWLGKAQKEKEKAARSVTLNEYPDL